MSAEPYLARSDQDFTAEVARRLDERWSEDDLAREHPIILAGTGRTLDDLRPPESGQRRWWRAHRDHHQGFMRDVRPGFVEYRCTVWSCIDCGAPEPDALNQVGDWAVVERPVTVSHRQPGTVVIP